MGGERGDGEERRTRADVYSLARIGAAAALTIVLPVLLVLDVAVPEYDVSPGILLPLLGAICALLGLEASAFWRGREVTTVTALLTNKAYGYPRRGARRRRKPTILACLHQTANAKATAIQERNYANRAGSPGPSATAYIDRDGTIVRAIDPAKYAAWSQGDVAHPNTRIPTIAAAVASGVNMNEWVHESIECSGAGTEPFTDAQFESVARLVAAAAKTLGIPINRSTVVVHADINSVSRRSDPWPPATREARVKRVISRANAILRPPITTVTVKAGDSLSAIASAHRLTLKALLAFAENAKYRANPGLIHPGDIVRVN